MELYIHHTPGRLRVRTPIVKSNPDEATAVVAYLVGAAGVKRVKTNARTGSITVYYDPHQLEPHEVVDLLSREQYLENVLAFPASGGAWANSGANSPSPIVPELQRLAKHPYVSAVLKNAARALLPVLLERYVGKNASKILSTII